MASPALRSDVSSPFPKQGHVYQIWTRLPPRSPGNGQISFARSTLLHTYILKGLSWVLCWDWSWVGARVKSERPVRRTICRSPEGMCLTPGDSGRGKVIRSGCSLGIFWRKGAIGFVDVLNIHMYERMRRSPRYLLRLLAWTALKVGDAITEKGSCPS